MEISRISYLTSLEFDYGDLDPQWGVKASTSMWLGGSNGYVVSLPFMIHHLCVQQQLLNSVHHLTNREINSLRMII